MNQQSLAKLLDRDVYCRCKAKFFDQRTGEPIRAVMHPVAKFVCDNDNGDIAFSEDLEERIDIATERRGRLGAARMVAEPGIVSAMMAKSGKGSR